MFAQYGRITEVDVIYNNGPGGAYREINRTALQSEQGRIIGTHTGKDISCPFRGNIGGMRS